MTTTRLAPKSPIATRRASRAFTLVELMLSIAISLILILGVSRVFSYSSDAVGAGQALSDVSRDARAAATVFARDLSGAVVDGSPCMILKSQQVFAFRNAADYASASVSANSFNGTQIPNPQYDELGNQIAPADYGTRSHRLDTFSFFAQGNFHRQTANYRGFNNNGGVVPTGFVADETAPEAWIWYGHLALPDNSLTEASARYPGDMGLSTTTNTSTPPSPPRAYNPNNLFASQWILGRQQILLQPADSNYMIYDRNAISQDYLCRPPGFPPVSLGGSGAFSYASKLFPKPSGNSPGPLPIPTPSQPPALSSPLTFPAFSTFGSSPTKDGPVQNVYLPAQVPSLFPLDVNTPAVLASERKTGLQNPVPTAPPAPARMLWESRYDVANTSIAEFREILKNYIEEMAYQRSSPPGQDFNVDWWDPLMATARFYGNPFVQKPLATPVSATNGVDPNKQYAQLSPCFLAGCSQFIVEYAGDFLNQDPATGNVKNTYVDGPTDGLVDFVVDPATGSRQIRWYGLPRAVPNAGSIPVSTTAAFGANPPPIYAAQNVYPLTDIWSTDPPANASPYPSCAPFEKIILSGAAVGPLNQLYIQANTPAPIFGFNSTVQPNYFLKRTSGADYLVGPQPLQPGNPTGGNPYGEPYICAWGPYDRKPSMIRITITMEDPNNHLPNGKTFQFVFRLGNGNGN